jgi:hypothetical protein
MSLSKKIRFEVFKRDAFKCQYCGSVPPLVVLEVDHIIPVSKGGLDEIDNLVTSCFDCNRGKSNRELTTMPQSTLEKTQQFKEKEEQYKEYQKAIAKIRKRQEAEIQSIEEVYSNYFPGWEFSERFKNSSVRTFIKLLGVEKVKESMHTACSRMYNEDKALKYFCGVCWRKIKQED